MRALIIDDSKTSRMVAGLTLKELGFETQQAENAEKALQLLETAELFNLAIVDWNMPGMNGLSFVKAVRENPKYGQMKIIMLTVESQVELVVQALEAGANEYVIKPISGSSLREKLALLGVKIPD